MTVVPAENSFNSYCSVFHNVTSRVRGIAAIFTSSSELRYEKERRHPGWDRNSIYSNVPILEVYLFLVTLTFSFLNHALYSFL